jgi:hypothetical protein
MPEVATPQRLRAITLSLGNHCSALDQPNVQCLTVTIISE